MIGLDIGGTTIKGGVFAVDGPILERSTVPTSGPDGPPFETVVLLITRLRAAAERDGYVLTGIGIGSPGVIDSEAGVVVFAANLGWSDLPIVNLLTERFGVPVAIDNDARVGALAERRARIARGDRADDLVFVPIGTGISAAVFTGGVPLRGATGGAGEFGHIPVVPGGERCTCGNDGCVEVYASASGILRRYRALGGTNPGGTRDVVNAADTDPIAMRVWADAVDALARGVAALGAMLDPEAIVIGGGLGESGERLLVPLRAAVQDLQRWRVPPLIESSLLGTGAGLAGAALLATPAAIAHDRHTPNRTAPPADASVPGAAPALPGETSSAAPVLHDS